MANVGIYNGTPTSGSTNGTLVSGGNPIYPGTLLTGTGAQVETAPLKLAARCINANTQTAATLNISLVGTNAAKWALAPDAGGTPGTFGAFGAALNVGTVGTSNVIFWIKAIATTGESVSTTTDDLSVSLSMSDNVITTGAGQVTNALTMPYSIFAAGQVTAPLVMPYAIQASASQVTSPLIMPYSIASSGANYAATLLAMNPTAYWKLDETTGAFTDSSGHGWSSQTIGSGITRGQASVLPSNASSNSISGDGTANQYILMNTAASTGLRPVSQTGTTTGFSVVTSMVQTSATNSIALSHVGAFTVGGYDGFWMGLDQNRKPFCTFYCSGQSTPTTLLGATAVALNTPIHMALVGVNGDGFITANAITLFVNGAQVAAAGSLRSGTGFLLNDAGYRNDGTYDWRPQWSIGAGRSLAAGPTGPWIDGSSPVIGRVDDTAVWINTPLSSTQITNLYNAWR